MFGGFMEYSKEQLKLIYDNAQESRNTFIELNDINNQLTIILKKMVFDEFVVEDIINTLNYFKSLNLLDKINEESINFAKKICYGKINSKIDKDNTGYFHQIIRNLLLPCNRNYCDKEYNLPKFFAEFDLFLCLILENCTMKDMAYLKRYNSDLYEIVKRFVGCNKEYVGSNRFNHSLLLEKMLMKNVLNHLTTVLYLSLEEYDYNYDLLVKCFHNIGENYEEFLLKCGQNHLFKGLLFSQEDQEIINEYAFCKELIQQTINPPVIIKKNR